MVAQWSHSGRTVVSQWLHSGQIVVIGEETQQLSHSGCHTEVLTQLLDSLSDTVVVTQWLSQSLSHHRQAVNHADVKFMFFVIYIVNAMGLKDFSVLFL